MAIKKYVTNYLYALQYVYVFVRFNPREKHHTILINLFDKYLNDELLSDKKVVKKLCKEIKAMSDFDSKDFILKCLRRFRVKKKACDFNIIHKNLSWLKEINQHILFLIEKQEYKRIHDLADAVHNFPEWLIKSDIWKASDFWEVYIEPYRKTWDNQFLNGWIKKENI